MIHKNTIQKYYIKIFNLEEIHKVHNDCNIRDIPRLKKWIEDPKFLTLNEIAIGARVMITQNIDFLIGAINDALGIVSSIKYNKSKTSITAIRVLIESSNEIINIKKSRKKRKMFGKDWYCTTSFPLILAYAITGHKSQGSP